MGCFFVCSRDSYLSVIKTKPNHHYFLLLPTLNEKAHQRTNAINAQGKKKKKFKQMLLFAALPTALQVLAGCSGVLLLSE